MSPELRDVQLHIWNADLEAAYCGVNPQNFVSLRGSTLLDESELCPECAEIIAQEIVPSRDTKPTTAA